jgi:predicted kinase
MNRSQQFLEICIGIAGCGKTTHAKKQVKEIPNTVMFSRDDFRFMVKDEPFCEAKVEEVITNCLTFAIGNALSVGLNVVVHNTHLTEKYIKAYDKFAKEQGVKIIYTVFDTPFDVCLERNRNRERFVPEDVMHRMNDQFTTLKGSSYFKQITYKPEPIVFNPLLPKAILFDLDGTVALMNGRSPYDGAKCNEDLLNLPIGELVYMYDKMGYKIIFLSGREDKWESQTREFLERHFATLKYELFMRKSKDMRKDSIVKEEIFRERVNPNYYATISVDDRLQVVRMWAEIGVFCLCCNVGLIEF